MLRLASCFLGLTLCVGLTGCDTGGPPVGTPPEVQGNVLPPGFEDLQKKQGGAMTNPNSVKPTGDAAAKEATKEATKEAAKEAPKEAAKPAGK